MSQILINDYLKQLDLIKRVSGSQRETIVREAFKDLLKAWGRQHDLVFLAEYPLKTATKTNIAVDGALLHELRMPLGYWEAKDAADDLDDEIGKKFKKGLPAGQHHLQRRRQRRASAKPPGGAALRHDGHAGAVEAAETVLQLRAPGDRRLPRGGGPVQDRPARRAASAARR